jgi:tetratricopeptide (TPR) repeat protein
MALAMTPEVERLLESGTLAEAEGNLREALVWFEAAVKLAHDQALPRLRLGTLCHRVRDYVRAGEALAEASRLDPENAEIAFRLALTCDALGDQERARTAYARTMMLAPGSWQTWFLIGRDHRELDHPEVARLAYLRAIEAAPDQPAELLFELGTLLWEMDMRDDGFALLERAVLACPVDPGFTLQLALAEMERDNLTAAHRLLTTAKHLDPADRRIDVALKDLSIQRNLARKRRRAA